MHEIIRFATHGPLGLWPEAVAVLVALGVAPILAALWSGE